MYVTAAPTITELISKVFEENPERLSQLFGIGLVEDGREYVHWDKLRHLEPPSGLSNEEWWLLIKRGRQSSRREIPLTDPCGRRFTYCVPDVVARRLHYVDQRCAGEVAMSEVVTADAHARERYLVNSLMEEAIRSSQLEGATTTRRVAKELLRTGRAPKDRSERMILNNYRALQYMRDEMPAKLTLETIIELQRILTDGTLDNPDAAGRLQRPDEERIAVVDRIDGTVLHTPPPAEQLPGRLRALCDFANEGESPERFIHPVLRAILLHFWLAYDHPFEDGNGRTARALFYWHMRTHGYWLVEYLSISRILRHAPGRYTRSFVLTETDERDTTYFVAYQLDVIERAVEQLHGYLRQKIKDVRDVQELLESSGQFNHRQLALLANALRVPDASYSFQAHAASHGVTHETARTDLLALVEMGFLERRRQGRRYAFTPPTDLAERLKGSS
ncbi:MAG TPA: Fic family protein [Solirubrobacteraceae bacterium]|jgi:Fic family protein|nr:Fic family protein [Solirubrobacteraceae bacterium]